MRCFTMASQSKVRLKVYSYYIALGHKVDIHINVQYFDELKISRIMFYAD